MKFGLSQFEKQTPIVISNIKRAINTFMGGVITFMPFIESHTSLSYTDISAIAGITLLAVNTLGSLFGVTEGEPVRPVNEKGT
jgi:hypothetical protein